MTLPTARNPYPGQGNYPRPKANPMTNNPVELQDAIERLKARLLEIPGWTPPTDFMVTVRHADLAAALSVSGDMRWQPIESAPDCEEGIIVCDAAKPNPAVGVARYMEGRWRGAHMEWGFVSEAIWPEPTHWMPLPEPPNPSGQQEDRDGE